MRVRRPGVLIRARDERGAVLMMVAICLLVLLGMLVLTFDLGRGVAIKRNMVAGADAAALAAARECGLAKGEAAAKQAATDLLVDNNGAATVTGFQIDPGPAQCSGVPNPDPNGKNEVTVTASVPQEYFFAQIFGFTSGTVVASATAEWTFGVQNPVPLKLDQLKVEDCTEGHEEGYAGLECAFAFEQVPGGTGSNRGILDFPEGWPVQGQDTNPMACTSNAGGANDLVDYINRMGLEGDDGFLPVLWKDAAGNDIPTYACAQGGVSAVGIKAIVDWLNTTAEMDPPPVVYFPVVACDGTAAPCHPWIKTPGREAYPVVDFVGMRVVGAWKGQEAKEHCTFTGKSGTGQGQGQGSGKVSSDVFCVQLAVAGLNDSPLGGAVRVRLVD
ncbi:MAG: pilus assembly protein TadG-related protein [Actinomycetota bacterium]